MTKASNDIPHSCVGSAVAQIMAGHSSAVGQSVFNGSVNGGVFIGEYEILAYDLC